MHVLIQPIAIAYSEQTMGGTATTLITMCGIRIRRIPRAGGFCSSIG